MNEYVYSVIEYCGGLARGEDGEVLGVMFHGEKQISAFANKIVEDCRDQFCVGSVSWKLLNENLESMKNDD